MFTEQDVEVVAGRLRSWSDVLADLADPDRCRELLTALDAGDAKAFHGIIDRWGFLGGSDCVEVAETFTRFVHTGDVERVRVCEFVNTLRPPHPSPTNGRGYTLLDGTVLWLSEADWWQLYDQAVGDEGWRKANYDLLVAVGIMRCHWERVISVQRFDITKTYTICPPRRDPREGGRRPRPARVRPD